MNGELEDLVEVARREMDAIRDVHPRHRDPTAMRAAWQAMTDRLIAAGADRVIAEWTTTIWALGGKDWCIRDCLAHAEYYAELGLIRPGNDNMARPHAEA